MSVAVNRRWLIASAPHGVVGEHNFRWTQSPVPVPSIGQALVRNLWLSLDPTQLLFMPSEGGAEEPSRIGEVIPAQAVGQVVESHLSGFNAGDIVQGFFGWEDYTVTDGSGFVPMSKVSPGVAPNLAVGTLGLTGMAAYFGVLTVGQPKPGETILISAAAGGVGSIAGQIARSTVFGSLESPAGRRSAAG